MTSEDVNQYLPPVSTLTLLKALKLNHDESGAQCID